MSQDTYQLDVSRHGGPHVDRYNRRGQNVGRYRLDKVPIPHKGRLPPPVPRADDARFEAEAAKAAAR